MTAARRSPLLIVAALAAIAALVAALLLVNAPRGASPELAAPGNHLAISAAQSANGPVAMGNGVFAGGALKHDRSPDLRTIAPQPVKALPADDGDNGQGGDNAASAPHARDTVVQTTQAAAQMPSTSQNFEGIDFPGVVCNCAPPDTNGEAGATQYVQIVNEGFQVWNKSTGASVYGPAAITTIWSGFGGVCASNGEGDPVVLYDQLAGRWLISQFAGTSQPTDECIAVSTSSDATAGWYRYDFHLGTNFFDYPKIAVWPDGYYMSMNVFNSSGTLFLGPQAFVFDRSQMLVGGAATFQTAANLGSSVDPILPADVDGSTPPPAGAPETYVRWPGAGAYQTYHYHVNWVTPSSSTFTTFASPAAAGFTQLCPTTASCVPQSGTSTGLDALADRLMFRLAYRNFGDHESVVGSYTVSSGGVAGVRWFELWNVTNGPETVHQESTYQPDTTWRWMPSAAMDHNGDIAVGFSASSSSMFPSIRYAGRLASDPLNTLAQGEATLFAGLGSQSATNSRWGDYSDMTIDPTDDCTFWYTTEYYPSGVSSFNWRTRIGSFTMPGCGSSPTTGTISGKVSDTNGGSAIAGATVTITAGGTGSTTTDAYGNYSFSNLTPGGYTVSASKSTYTTGAGSTANATVTAGNTSTANLTLTSTLGSISGQVTSTSNGAAIASATVTLSGAGSGSTTTDANGDYSFGNLTPGAYTVTPSQSGYQPASGTGTSVSAGANTVTNLTLTPYPTTSTPFDFPTTAPTPVTSNAGDNNGYQNAPTSWWTAFDGNVASDTSSGTGGSQTCGATTRDQEVFTGYSFGSLGSGSILGIQVQLRGRASSSSSSPKFCVQLWNGTSWTTGKVTSSLKTSLTTYTLGTTSDLWGSTWSAASLGSGFKLRITDLANSTSRSFYLDGVSVSVTYQ